MTSLEERASKTSRGAEGLEHLLPTERDRLRRETENEQDVTCYTHPYSTPGQWSRVEERWRVRPSYAQKQGKESPHQPRRAEISHWKEQKKCETGDAVSARSEQRVAGVSPVQLTYGYEIDGGGKQTEPRGETDGTYVEHLAVGKVRPDPMTDQFEEDGLSERQPPIAGWSRPRLGDADDECGQSNNETRKGPTESNIYQRAPMWKWGLDENEGAQCPYQRERKGDEVGQCRLESVIACREVVSHLMRQQDGHDGQAERSPENQQRHELVTERHGLGEKLRRFRRRKTVPLVGTHQERGSDGQQKQDDGDYWEAPPDPPGGYRVDGTVGFDANRGSWRGNGFLGS
jgi:hypothetical protein